MRTPPDKPYDIEFLLQQMPRPIEQPASRAIIDQPAILQPARQIVVQVEDVTG